MSKSRILLIAVALFAVLSVISCNSQTQSDVFTIGPRLCCIRGLHAPWDAIHDSTIVAMSCDGDSLYFDYLVPDTTITLCENYSGELDVNPEDRVEVFFSPRDSMDVYYCAEIDPMGRVMDYKASYYRQFDFDWNFRTMKVDASFVEGGYRIKLTVARQELCDLGLDLENGFYMGVFRADFHSGSPENWFSAVNEDREKADFHIPSQLFKVKIL